MRNLHAIAEKNLRIDAELLACLQGLGVVTTQYDMSRLCGMNESYYSSMKAKGYGLTLGSLVYLCTDLAKRSREVREPRVGAVLNHAVGLVQRAIDEKCRLRQLELAENTGSNDADK